jgi:hypothetical protein
VPEKINRAKATTRFVFYAHPFASKNITALFKIATFFPSYCYKSSVSFIGLLLIYKLRNKYTKLQIERCRENSKEYFFWTGITKGAGWISGNAPYLYVRGGLFESPWGVPATFTSFLGFYLVTPDNYRDSVSVHDVVLPTHFQFTIHRSTYH